MYETGTNGRTVMSWFIERRPSRRLRLGALTPSVGRTTAIRRRRGGGLAQPQRRIANDRGQIMTYAHSTDHPQRRRRTAAGRRQCYIERLSHIYRLYANLINLAARRQNNNIHIRYYTMPQAQYFRILYKMRRVHTIHVLPNTLIEQLTRTTANTRLNKGKL